MYGLGLTWQSRLSLLSRPCLPPRREAFTVRGKSRPANSRPARPCRATSQLCSCQVGSRGRLAHNKGRAYYFCLIWSEWPAKLGLLKWAPTPAGKRGCGLGTFLTVIKIQGRPRALPIRCITLSCDTACLPASRPGPRHRCLLEIQGRLRQMHAPLRAPAELLRGVMTDQPR